MRFCARRVGVKWAVFVCGARVVFAMRAHAADAHTHTHTQAQGYGFETLDADYGNDDGRNDNDDDDDYYHYNGFWWAAVPSWAQPERQNSLSVRWNRPRISRLFRALCVRACLCPSAFVYDCLKPVLDQMSV